MRLSPTPVIFDLDGTLVDSEPHYFEAGRLVLARHGVPGFTWEEHTRFLGVGTRQTLTTLRGEHGIQAPVEELLAEKDAAYLRLATAAPRVFPRMRELVEQLLADGHPLAVASGSSPAAIEAVLTASGLGPMLPVRVSAEDVARGKPEPDVFLEAARRLGSGPERCVAVEDAVPGALAARRAGMGCVAVPYLPDAADDPAFAPPVLLFPGGQREFDPRQALRFIRSRSSRDSPGPRDRPDC